MTLSACQYCGRQNETGAQFCTDCGKPLTKAAAARAAVAAGGGGGVVSRTSGPGSPGGAPADAPCPLCGAMVTAHSASDGGGGGGAGGGGGSEEHTSELQSPCNLVCRLLLEKKKKD